MLGKYWAGKVYGTNTGNLSADIECKEAEVSGVLRFMDDRFGLAVYKIAGTFDGASIELKGEATQAPENVQTGSITVTGTLTSEGSLRGKWTSSIGTGGMFALFPHDVVDETPRLPGSLPEQLHTATRRLGVIRLYADDVRALIDFIKRDFGSGRVVVTYHQRGTEISKFASDFEKDIPHLNELRFLRIQIQEPEAHGLNRVAIVELNSNTWNEVRVQGVQESWVIGKAEALTGHIRQHQKKLPTAFRRFGLNINTFITLGTLVLAPELPLQRRIIFVAVVAIVLWAISEMHSRYIPNALIILSDKKPGLFGRAWPQFVSWILGIAASTISAATYGLLKGYMPWITNWIASFFN